MITVQKTESDSFQSEINPSFISNIKHDSPLHRKLESNENMCLSPLSEAASQTGLDIVNSSRYLNENAIFFNFRFDDTQIKSIHTNGFWELKSKKMEMNLSFEVNESILIDGHETNRQLKFQLHVSVENLNFKQVNIHEHKEKLPEYLLRIAQTIADYAASKDKEITSLILDLKDAKEIFSLDNGKTLKNIIAIISLIHMTNNILDKDKKGVILHIPRKKEIRKDYFETKYTNIRISIKVEESIINKPLDKSPQKEPIGKHTDSLNESPLEKKNSDITHSKNISSYSKTSKK